MSDLEQRDIFPGAQEGEEPCLGVGWHAGLSMRFYLEDPGISSSILKLAPIAPALALAAMQGRLDDGQTKASLEGELIHTALLEPDYLNERYLVSGNCQAVLKSGKRKGQQCGSTGQAVDPELGWVCGVHGAKELKAPTQDVVTSAQWRMAIQLRDNALVEDRPLHHPDAKKLLEQAGEAELTGIFQDPGTGERGRIRLDRWLDIGWSLDVKTVDVGKAAGHRLARHGWNRQWHLQQGWYGHGAGVLDREVKRHVILAAERGYPYLVQPYLLPPELVDYGRREALDALGILAECRASGEWVGYSDSLEELELLGWQKAILARIRDGAQAEGDDGPPDDFGLW